MSTLNTKLEQVYPDIAKWAIRTYGVQNGHDYVHDAAVILLEHYDDTATRKLSDNAFLGLCRIHVTKAYALARHALLSRRVTIVSLDDAKDVVSPADRIAEARKLVRHILPHIPFAGRKIMYRRYVLGESERECSTALGVSRARIRRLEQKTIVFLGELVKQSNLEE